MSSYLEWNILLAVLAAELVRFHIHRLQTKWDLGGFVFASVSLRCSQTGMPQKHITRAGSLWNITLSVVAFDGMHDCITLFKILNDSGSIKRCVCNRFGRLYECIHYFILFIYSLRYGIKMLSLLNRQTTVKNCTGQTPFQYSLIFFCPFKLTAFKC